MKIKGDVAVEMKIFGSEGTAIMITVTRANINISTCKANFQANINTKTEKIRMTTSISSEAL